jgi:hypothetical protein
MTSNQQEASEITMNLGEHIRVTGGALKSWLIAQMQDSIAIGVLWLMGLYALRFLNLFEPIKTWIFKSDA